MQLGLLLSWFNTGRVSWIIHKPFKAENSPAGKRRDAAKSQSQSMRRELEPVGGGAPMEGVKGTVNLQHQRLAPADNQQRNWRPRSYYHKKTN